MQSVVLVALSVELFELIGQIIDRLLVTLLETRLRRLVLNADQFEVLLQLLDLVLATSTYLTLTCTSIHRCKRVLRLCIYFCHVFNVL